MAVWTLTHAGTTKTFAEWGLGGLKRTQVSQAVGGVSFTQSGAAYDGEPLFAIDAVITISKDGVAWHVGPVIMNPRTAGARSESLEYQVADMWWFIEQLPYEQSIVTGAGGTATQTTRIALFADVVEGGTVKSNAELMISKVIALVVTAGAEMQVSFTGNFGVSPPISDMRDPTCGEVIRQVLRWVPDATAGWDYATTPPTLRIATRAAATARSIDLADQVSVNLINIAARDDLRKERVVIAYEITETVDDETYVSIVTDAAGSGSPFRTLKATLPLSGPQTQRQKQYLETEAISEGNAAWWKKRVPTLENATDLTISEGAIEPEDAGGDSFDLAIIDGQVPGWLDDEESPASGSMRVNALATYKVPNESGGVVEYKDDPISVTLSCTYLTTGVYTRVTSYTAGEAVPVGVAASLLAGLGLQYDGQLKIKKRECSFIARPGDVLNLLNGHSDWATGRMQVQKVDEDVDAGATTITFGPPKHLGPQDVIEMLRTLRGRPPVQNLDERASGKKGAGNDAKGGRTTANSNGNASAAGWHRLRAKSPDSEETMTLDAKVGVKLQKGDAFIEQSTADQRSTHQDSSGNKATVEPTKIEVLDADGDGVTITSEGITFHRDGKATLYALNRIGMDDNTGKTNEITPAGMSLGDGDKLAGYAAVGMDLEEDDKFTQLHLNHMLMDDGSGKTLLLNEEQVIISNGPATLILDTADALQVSNMSGTLSAKPTEVAMVVDGLTAKLTPVNGLDLADAGTGTVKIAVIAGKQIESRDTDMCVLVAGVPTQKTVKAVRSATP